MKKLFILTLFVGLVTVAMAATATDSTATLDFDFVIPDVEIITITGQDIDVTMPVPEPGADWVDATAYSAYEVYHNSSDSKQIVASFGAYINPAEFTSGVTLYIRADAPSEGASAEQDITSSAVNIVTGLTACSDTDLQLEFRFEVVAGTAAGSYSDMLTLTLEDE